MSWQRLADVKPNTGQLVEYRGVNPECARKSYSAIGTVPKKGHFVKDCGTHWTENLNGFTTEKLGVIVAPDPDITFWRALWLCNKCDVGVLDSDKKVRSPKNRIEAVVICPECGAENPVWSFTSDPACAPPSDVSLVVGGVPSDSDVEPFMSGNSGLIEPGVADTGMKYSLRAGSEILNSEVPIPFASCGCPCCGRALLALTFRTPS